ncbi:hypothetical protein PSACC_00691 [Paramicrosporidium saccamoebae]|uniref:Uncharacterized protein n=1 Tax=Paramicrosporidium saccamoebae TaxID=1246581 RepID=A0A2H9TP35_9FUNG|nr:hypothetical protein PSACC_00691 [Paramicrosporidium saccamoebae]
MQLATYIAFMGFFGVAVSIFDSIWRPRCYSCGLRIKSRHGLRPKRTRKMEPMAVEGFTQSGEMSVEYFEAMSVEQSIFEMQIQHVQCLIAICVAMATATIDIEEQMKLKSREMAIFEATQEANLMRNQSPEEELLNSMSDDLLVSEGLIDTMVSFSDDSVTSLSESSESDADTEAASESGTDNEEFAFGASSVSLDLDDAANFEDYVDL